MADTQMEAAIRTLVQQVGDIAQILPTLATKADLERFASKDDLERFATRDDLQRFATRDDLQRFATRDDLDEGLERVKRQSLVLFESLRDDIRLIAEALAVYSQKTDATAARLASLVETLQRKGVI
ncbi:MAG: hypothetical protein AB7P99_07045 [Vicinamibacterales bacterium]